MLAFNFQNMVNSLQCHFLQSFSKTIIFKKEVLIIEYDFSYPYYSGNKLTLIKDITGWIIKFN